MTQTAEEKEIKKLEAMLKQVKFGDMFKPSQFASAEEAQKFIAEFQKKLPVVDEERLNNQNMIVKTGQEALDYSKKEAENENAKYFGTLPIANSFNYLVPQFVSDCVDENGKSLYPEFDEAHKKRCDKPGGDVCDPLDPPMPKEIQELCYPFMKEWRAVAMKGGNHEEIMAVKTPYEKLPLKTRIGFRIKKALGMKTDPKVSKLYDLNWVVKADRKSSMEGAWNVYSWRSNEASNKYLNDLLGKPWQEMVEQMNNDLPIMGDDSRYMDQNAKDLEKVMAGHIKDRDNMLKINSLCAEIIGTMEDKSQHFFKVREHAHGARVSLAHKGMMPNEEVKEPAVSGVVANERVTKAKAKGDKLDWTEAKKRKNGKGSR